MRIIKIPRAALEIFWLIVCFNVVTIYGAVVRWLPDSITLQESFLEVSSSQYKYQLSILSSGPIVRHSTGNFRLNISVSLGAHFRPLYAVTDCLNIADKMGNIEHILSDTILGEYPLVTGDETPLRNYLEVHMTALYDDFHGSTNRSDYSFNLELYTRHSAARVLNVAHTTESCYPLKTYGYWEDSSRWKGGKAPNFTDSVIIPAETGIVFIRSNVTVRDLTVLGGEVNLQESSCPSGWTPDDRQFNTNKCYRLFDTNLDYSSAEQMCNQVVGAGSSDDRHLLHISDAEENDLARRICRGASVTSEAAKKGCWIGLHIPSNTASSSFQWISSSAVGAAVSGKRNSMFLDWRRNEPNNMTVSNGTVNFGGERCAHLVPWQQDPHIIEQGSWADDKCENTRPFVCQVFAVTIRYSITVTNHTEIVYGVIQGGSVYSMSSANIQSLYLLRTAALYLSASTTSASKRLSPSTLQEVWMMDSARLVILASVVMQSGAFIGDMEPTSYRYFANIVDLTSTKAIYAQSQVIVTKTGTISIGDVSASVSCVAGDVSVNNVTMDARLVVKGGNVTVAACNTLLLRQGGDLARARVALNAATSVVSLDGYSSLLTAFDSFNLHSANRGPFIGEYYDGNMTSEFRNEHQGVQRGIYRLSVRPTTAATSSASISTCIPYNATASELASILNALSIVQSYGGVSVRRYGDANAQQMRFGFSYRIDFDAPHTSNFLDGSLTLSVYCYGTRQRDCQCAQTKVPLIDPSGSPQCPNHANISTVDADICVYTPEVLLMERVSTLSHIDATGSGALQFTAGLHRLPPVTTHSLTASTGVRIQGSLAGRAVVSADEILWYDVLLTGSSRVYVAGTGWAGWDSVFDLFAPDWENERGLSALNRAPACLMQVHYFSINHLASVFSTGPGSNFSWVDGEWNGGVLGGRAHISISERLLLNASRLLSADVSSVGVGFVNNNRALRDVMTLTLLPTATAEWITGNISLANAATIVNEGVFIIGNLGNSNTSTTSNFHFPFAMGEAEYLNDSTFLAFETNGLLDIHPGRSWQSYYSADLIYELRAGWYLNPFCGMHCGSTNLFVIQGSGELQAKIFSKTSFVLPVYMIDQSRFNLDQSAEVNFASGGTLGNEVIVTLGAAARLELSGGRMLMQATCTIQGSGDLQVTGGAHDLSFIIDARITISGGRLTWPQSRGTGKTITFRGGLVIEQSGQLIVEPQSTVIQVESDVFFTDNSLIQFPVLGVAAQSTPFDGPDFPDTSPRCTLIATKILRWAGGTIAGKVDIISRSFLYLDGATKRVESLAKLLNYGHCEWSSGDLMIENQGDFVNYGSIQMALGQAKFDANVVYKGTSIPLENGGDPFAKDFHTYDLDPGGLNYAEYVALNGELVSILPEGWTPASQISGDGQGGLSQTHG